jgi:hypothetical protein
MSQSESFKATVDEYNFGDKALFLSGKRSERERIIKLLLDLNVVRRCAATNKLVAFDTNGKNVLYLTGLETEGNK